ncbi:MAG TPA: tetratricopeptide repeat protein [Nitrosopumilus sp.]|nr:tetratricopeptide repeat protein [Nitrosopumilus sp.]
MGTKTGFIPLILTLCISFPLAFGDNSGGIIASTDKEFYEAGESLFITGQVEKKKMPILALRIFDPDGSILSANNVKIEKDNSFSKMVSLDSPFYDEPGTYTVKIDYGKLDKEITFEIKSGGSSNETIFVDYEEIIPELTGLETDKSAYTDNDTITISGTVNSIDETTVLIGIHDPFGVPTGFYFGEINSNNEFFASFLAKAGINFKIDGTYTILAYYGESKKEISFDFVESTPTEIIEEVEQTEIIEDETEQAPTIIVKETIPETKDVSITENKLPKPKQEKKSVKAKNLSVEDIELGILLNQITLNCDKNDYIDTISYYDGMGPAMIRLCKYSEAITFFDQELIDDPNNVQSLTNKGAALAKLGHFEEAILYYDYALEINPSFVSALNNKGNALSQLWKFNEAIGIYNAAKNLDPDNKILTKNFALSESRFVPLDENQKPIFEPLIQNTKGEKIEKFEEVKPKKDSEEPDFFEQIGIVFSSIRSIFGFQ